MRKIKFIEQKNEQDCGLACISMLLTSMDKNISIESLRKEYKINSNGLSMGNIVQIIKEKGGEVINGKSNNIKDFLTPCIIHLTKGHFVILEKTKRHLAYIIDPSNGRETIEISELNEEVSPFFIYIESIGYEKRMEIIGIKEFLPILTSIIIITLFIHAISLQSSIIIKYIIDNIKSLNTTKITFMTTLLIIIFFTINWIRGLLVIKFENKLDFKIMSQFIHKLIQLPISEFMLRNNGDLIFRSTANNIIKQIVTSRVAASFIDSVFLTFYTYILFSLSINMGVLILLSSTIILTLTVLNVKKIIYLTNKDVLAKSKLQDFYTEVISRIKDIKTENLKEVYLNNWEKQFLEQIETFKEREIYVNKTNILIQTYQFGLPLLIFGYGILQVEKGLISMSTLIAINILATMYILPVASISGSLTEIIYVRSYVNKITDIIKFPNPEPLKQDMPDSNFSLPLIIRELRYTYGTFEKDVIKNINMQIPPNKKVAIIGKSGSGKSTLLKILAGIYDDYKGEIFLGDKKLSDYKLGENVGIILQDSNLFNKSIKDNISLTLSEKECWSLLREVYLYDFVKKLPYGLKTKVTEASKNFSGGEIQKILIARSLANNPKLLLYDEATSALDNENQKLINSMLNKRNITQVIVAHRLSTVVDADLIYILEDGEVIESGNPQKLLVQNSAFKNLFDGGINLE